MARSIEQIIDHVLQYSVGYPNCKYLFDILCDINSENSIHDIMRVIERDKLAEIKKMDINAYSVIATEKTHEIVKDGGYLKFLDKKNQEKKKIEEKRKEMEFQNNFWNVKINKWYHKTRWLPFFISVVALIISILTYCTKHCA